MNFAGINRDNFWKSSPKEYASNLTEKLDEESALFYYPLAYLFRSFFTIKFWFFSLASLIVVILLRELMLNKIE